MDDLRFFFLPSFFFFLYGGVGLARDGCLVRSLGWGHAVRLAGRAARLLVNCFKSNCQQQRQRNVVDNAFEAIALFKPKILNEKTGKNLHTFNQNQTHKINTIKDPNILKPQLNSPNYLHSINLIFKTSYFQYHGDLFDLMLPS